MSDKRDDEKEAESTNSKSKSTSTASDSDSSSQEGFEDKIQVIRKLFVKRFVLFSDNAIDVIRRFFSQTLSLDSGESSEKNDIVLDKVGSIHCLQKGLKHPNVIIGYS